MRYFGDWAVDAKYGSTEREYAGVLRDFGIASSVVADSEILFAAYTYEGYSGSAFVLYERDGKLYEVNGGHCSCYGLEDQWEPEETSWEALRMRLKSDKWLTPAGTTEFAALLDSRSGAVSNG